MKRLLTLAAFGCAAGIATADPVTWLIDEPWDFYTSTNPPQGNLVGSVTFDRDVNAFWPVAWSFTLEHHDPLLQPYYPITISSALNPSVSSVSGGWQFYGQNSSSMQTWIVLNFASNGPDVLNILLDGSQPSVTFGANEWVWRYDEGTTFASSRLINGGTASLIPAPGALAVLAGFGAMQRRRRR